MARDAAVISTWTRPVAGRESKALEVFMELMQFWGKHAADGKVEQPEVFFNYDGSEGIFVVKGRSDVLMEIEESDEGQKLLAKGHMIVEGLRSHFYFTGDEEVMRGTQLLAQAGNELGYM
jgi:hypothetical protein